MDFEADPSVDCRVLTTSLSSATGRCCLDGSSAWLFPGRPERPQDEQAITARSKPALATKCGVKVNPHLFRHSSPRRSVPRQQPGRLRVCPSPHGRDKSRDHHTLLRGMERAARLSALRQQHPQQRAKPTPQAKSVGAYRRGREEIAMDPRKDPQGACLASVTGRNPTAVPGEPAYGKVIPWIPVDLGRTWAPATRKKECQRLWQVADLAITKGILDPALSPTDRIYTGAGCCLRR